MVPTAKKAAAKKPATSDKSEASKPKRKSYTAEERIAKLEADLAAAKEKASQRQQKEIESAKDKVSKLDEKIDGLRVERANAQTEVDRLIEGQPIEPSVVDDDVAAAQSAVDDAKAGADDDEDATDADEKTSRSGSAA